VELTDVPHHARDVMTIGTSLFLIAVGAILRYAVTAHVSGFDIQTAGVILIAVGVAGLLIGLFLIVRDRSGAPPPGGMP
jgi:ABC-type microcin C transport system permease subunit YejB